MPRLTSSKPRLHCSNASSYTSRRPVTTPGIIDVDNFFIVAPERFLDCDGTEPWPIDVDRGTAREDGIAVEQWARLKQTPRANPPTTGGGPACLPSTVATSTHSSSASSSSCRAAPAPVVINVDTSLVPGPQHFFDFEGTDCYPIDVD
ncbi:hypothetical protein C8J57DRAFT_1538042 [Mycena rebaudengoi]|nr:hypothetical protein C8J57DRAFT_1538042 [Mycena rebaudengoi]